MDKKRFVELYGTDMEMVHEAAFIEDCMVRDDVGGHSTMDDVIFNAYEDKEWRETFPGSEV